MGTIVIIIIILAIIVALYFMLTSKSREKMLFKRQEALARAKKGKAKILEFTLLPLSGTGNHGYYKAYTFTLEVSNGYDTPYKTESVWEVYPIGTPNAQQGLEIDVKIDADDPNTIYPLATGVEYSWNAAMMYGKKKP